MECISNSIILDDPLLLVKVNSNGPLTLVNFNWSCLRCSINISLLLPVCVLPASYLGRQVGGKEKHPGKL